MFNNTSVETSNFAGLKALIMRKTVQSLYINNPFKILILIYTNIMCTPFEISPILETIQEEIS
jgi:hypothetical protein